MSGSKLSQDANRRLEPDERRALLVKAGVALMNERAFDEIGAAEVARAAGVSKALVFHYFPSTRDLRVALAQAVADELLEAMVTDPTLSYGERLALGLERFIDYVERQPATYRAIARSAGVNEELLAVYEHTRAGVATLILEALGFAEAPPMVAIFVRGWQAMAEEAVLTWLVDRPVPRAELVAMLERLGLAVLEAVADAKA